MSEAATAPAETPRLLEKYVKDIRGSLKEKFTLANVNQIPCLLKIVVNMGVGEAVENTDAFGWASHLALPKDTPGMRRKSSTLSRGAWRARLLSMRTTWDGARTTRVVVVSSEVDWLRADPRQTLFRLDRDVDAILVMDDDALMQLSREGCLSLDIDEMRTVQKYFKDLGRLPTDIELESIAQSPW